MYAFDGLPCTQRCSRRDLLETVVGDFVTDIGNFSTHTGMRPDTDHAYYNRGLLHRGLLHR